jgi:hypothetical protein
MITGLDVDLAGMMHHDWAFRRNLDGSPTLLIPVDARAGLHVMHCAGVAWWLDKLAAA